MGLKKCKTLVKFSYAVAVVVALLFTQYAWASPAIEYFGPAPLEPQLSSDGKTLYNAGQPVVYVDNPNPSYVPLRIPARFDLLKLPEYATATFSITYVADGGTDPWGERCYTFPEEAKTPFDAAANIWANILQSSVPVTISACWASLTGSSLGYSGGGPLRRNFAGAPLANTWYAGSLANALAGSDLDPSRFDMHITYNLNFSWYYGTDGNTPSTQHDLMTVVLHEIAHGLNFSGSMTYSGGQGSWGYGTGYPNIYDTFMRDGSGNQLIDTGVYANPSTALGSALTSDDIWFHGSNAMAANSGGRVKMYAPSTWRAGSSYSHLDYDTFNNTLNQLMVYAISAGESIHDPGPITRGLLKDLGWNISTGPICTYSISPTSQSFNSNGGTGSVSVATQSGCDWTAVSNASWIIITSNSSGTGSGTVNYSVDSNTSASARTGTMTIAGRTFTVSQERVETNLTNGVPQSGSITGTSAQSNWVYYYAELGSGATNLVLQLYNLSNDADLYVRRGSKPTTSTYDCRSWNSGTTSEQCSFGTPSSGTWWIGVNNWATGTISYTIKATWTESSVCTPPSVITHPQGRTIQSGQTATLSVTASGTAPLSYQWYRGTSGDTSNPISGATSNNYTTPALTQTTSYWVRVSNSCGYANSNTATITVTTTRRNPDTTGIFRPSNGALYLKNTNATGFADIVLTYGLPGDKPVVGDWNGDGRDTIGVYRNGIFYLRNSNTNGYADLSFTFGLPGDLPVAGDWNGDGIDTIGVYRDGTFFLRNSNSSGAPDIVLTLGIPGDVPIAGDWTGKGFDTVGIFRPSNGALYLKNTNTTGFADIVLTYGLPGDKPVVGDWDGDGVDTIGVYRNGVFYLRNSNTNGYADITFGLGVVGDEPIAGDWDGLP